MKRMLLTMLLGGTLCAAFAQEDSSKTTEKAPVKSYGKLTMNYLTNSVYNGRQDSISTPYLTPTLAYYAKSGFFVDGSLSYLTRSGSGRIDLTTFDMGYDFTIGKFDGEISGSKFFYNSNSTNTKSSQTGSLSASAAYDFGFIHPSLLGAINFGSATDYALTASLDHAFYAAGDNLVITPTVLLNAGTRNYYSAYYNQRKYAKLRKKVYYDINADVSGAAQFQALDYEFTVPIEYTVKSFTFSFLPSYAMPVNAAVITVNVKSSATSATVSKTTRENISNTFFAAFEVAFKF